MLKLSIIICTYNRFEIVADCLRSLCEFANDQSSYEILVIDNNSTDDTKPVVESFTTQMNNLKYIYEPKQGLSRARNRGAHEATGEWLFYLDDDAKVIECTLPRLFEVVSSCSYDLYGGMYEPFFHEERPYWLPENYGAKKFVQDTLGELKDYRFISGGVMVCKKSVIETLDGFSSNFGMNGRTVAYGEETELCQRALKMGFKLGFDPDLKILHLVRKEKLRLAWHLKENISRARNTVKVSQNFRITSNSLLNFMSDLIIIVNKDGLKLFKLFYTSKGFQWEKLLYGLGMKLCWRIGHFLGVNDLMSRDKTHG